MDNLTFSVDSALLNELGEKLVESVHIALVELVKNAYDADATEVIVKIIPQDFGGTEIHIIDNGSGMTLNSVKKYWMRIATTNKLLEDKSPIFGRPKTGSKGIGRFSCRRLGKQLILKTIAKHENGRLQKTQVAFYWEDFEAGTDVTTIKCPGSTSMIDKGQTGTELIISGNKNNEWQIRGYKYLKRQLAILVANRGIRRKGFKEDPGFNLFIEASDLEGAQIIDLREEYIKAGWCMITGQVDSEGNAACHLDALGIGKKSIIYKEKLPNLANIHFKIGMIVQDKEYMKNPSLLSKGILAEILPQWGGIQIRYNGFRVYPYGDDDWLDIDIDRGRRLAKSSNDQLVAFAEKLKGVDPGRALLSLMNMRSHMGNVEIDSSASGFELKASREGFLHSESVDQLKKWVRFAVDWATIYRDYFMRTKLEEKSAIAREHLEYVLDRKVQPENTVEEAVQFIKQEIKAVSGALPQAQKHEIQKSFFTAADAILKHEKSKTAELHHLRLIASTSTLLLIFSHEVKSLIGLLSANSASLQSIENRLPVNDKLVVKEIKDRLKNTQERFSELLKMTSLIGVDSKSASPYRLELKERISKAIKCYGLVINAYNISISEDIPDGLLVGPIMEAELYSVILNILSNSIKAVLAGGKNREICISAKKLEGKTAIEFRDTGIGIEEKDIEDIFLPFVADPSNKIYPNLEKVINPEDRYIFGMGSGLGLSITKEIIQIRKGSISFLKPYGQWSSILEVTLP